MSTDEVGQYAAGVRLPMPSDCATCMYPKWMHDEGEPQEGCSFAAPDDQLRKQRLLLRRAAWEAS